ncbi:MAG: site-specific integrase [Oscillospiraceae bacterium]
MARTGENIYKRKDGRWEGRYIRQYDDQRKPKYGYVYAKTYAEVKQKLAEQRCSTKSEITPSGVNVKYDAVLTAWLQSTKIAVKESTFAKYSQLIDSHIRPDLGQYSLSRISTQILRDFIQRQLLTGRLDGQGGLSPKTVIDMLTIIKESMTYAEDNGIVVACNPQRLTVKKTEKEMRVLTPQEQEALVRVLLNEMSLPKFGVLLSLYTGIRIGELCALQWEDLCLSSSTLKIRKTIQRIQDRNAEPETKTKVIITEPKSQCSIRDIPLPLFIVELAKRFVAEPEAYVLSGTASKYVEPRIMQGRFKRYIAEAKIADANFHATRHTFATRCVEIGFDIKSLSEILGHANVNITLNRYVHSSFELKCNNMSKLTLPL